MKKFWNALLTVIFLSGISSAQHLNDAGLYEDENGALFTGSLTSIQSKVKAVISVQSGVAEGPVFYYSEDGALLESGIFRAGHKHDKWTRFTAKGTISAIAFYNLGKKHGQWLVFDDNGNKRFEISYDNGSKTGIWTSWDQQGQITDIKDYSKVN